MRVFSKTEKERHRSCAGDSYLRRFFGIGDPERNAQFYRLDERFFLGFSVVGYLLRRALRKNEKEMRPVSTDISRKSQPGGTVPARRQSYYFEVVCTMTPISRKEIGNTELLYSKADAYCAEEAFRKGKLRVYYDSEKEGDRFIFPDI